FLTARGLEQIKNDVAYSNNIVNIVGISAGVSYGALGTTHHSLHDYAALRAINNIDIIAPADNFETREAVRALLNHPYPVYMRLGKRPMYDLHPSGTQFEIGKAITIREGSDATIIAIGEPTSRAVMAADLLAEEGIHCRVISMHTLRPFDTDALLNAAHTTRAIVTVEEHSVSGGLGERCASILMENRISIPFKIVGIPDEYVVNGSQFEIFDHYGISRDGLAAHVRNLLKVEDNS
ncbi:MAG TPA: transketolase C-terminal domain-containing protein, partial [Aggregatilineales bacterium]|nr:transketolase C-terminal domain-containing protein [Aggregatilineales bacterium]